MSEKPDLSTPDLPPPRLTVTLTYLEWCTVVAHLGGGVYREVAPVVAQIMAQLLPQADAQQQQAILATTPAASDLRN